MDNPELGTTAPRRASEQRESDATATLLAGRPTCYRCFRPRTFCYCGLVSSIDNRTSIVILQHPRERFHPIGTARIAQLALRNCRIEVDHARCFSRGTRELQLPPNTGLLYPEAPSRLLHEVPVHERPQHLLVLDGTWHHARYLFRDVPGLAQLPRYSIDPPAPSHYRLRKEPAADFVSTIEAIAYCLKILEPDNRDVDRLLDVFHEMIDRQIIARDGARTGRSFTRRRPQATRRFPKAFAEDFEHVVTVFTEAPEGRLARLCALRLSTGESFDAIIRPDHLLDPYYVEHMGLDARDLDAGMALEAARHRFAAFVGRDDVLVGWNHSTLAGIRGWMPLAQRVVSLKAAYQALNRHGGSLDEIAAAESLPPVPIPLRGRARQRLGNAAALCRFLNRLATVRDT